MRIENHEEIRLLIDKQLGETLARDEDKFLVEHLESCEECQKYRAGARDVVAAMEGFTFEVAPELNARVHRSMQEAVSQMEAQEQERKQMRVASLFAFVLSFLGSSVVWPVSDFLAARFEISAGVTDLILLLLWVAPSLLVSLLLPVISSLLNRQAEKGWRS